MKETSVVFLTVNIFIVPPNAKRQIVSGFQSSETISSYNIMVGYPCTLKEWQTDLNLVQSTLPTRMLKGLQNENYFSTREKSVLILSVVQCLSDVVPNRLHFLTVTTVRSVELHKPHPCVRKEHNQIKLRNNELENYYPPIARLGICR